KKPQNPSCVSSGLFLAILPRRSEKVNPWVHARPEEVNCKAGYSPRIKHLGRFLGSKLCFHRFQSCNQYPSRRRVAPRSEKVLPRFQPDDVESFQEAFPGVPFFGDQQILKHCQSPEKCGNLECSRNSHAVQFVRGKPADIFALIDDLPGVWLVESADYVDERRLSRAIWSHKNAHLTFFDIYRDRV